MIGLQAATALVVLAASASAMAGASSIDDMQWQRRILLASSPARDDPALLEQRAILAAWPAGASDRDLSFVQIAGPDVTGADDGAAALRDRYRISPKTFEVLLIGKDGHVAMRSHRPIAADSLRETIDAMPMRRNGGR